MRLAGHHHSRRGSVYVVVLSTALIVTLIGLSALMIVRIKRRSAEGSNDLIQARFHAQSAIELGVLWIERDPDWRTALSNATWAEPQPIGSGEFTLQGTDPGDGNLTDSPADPVLLTGIGVNPRMLQGQVTRDQARHMIQVTLAPVFDPLPALNTCLHSAGNIEVLVGRSITLTGAPISSNGDVRNDGTILGDVEAATLTGSGSVTGTVTTPAAPKQMPDSNVIDMYAGMATPIPFPGTIDRQVISPDCNPWGSPSPDGVYFIDTGGNDLLIKNARVHGTLVVQTHGGKVILDEAVLLHHDRVDYPALIVGGNVEMLLTSGSSDLSEEEWGTNFNPAGAPYQGISDTDTLDTYPNEIRGLVHVYGTLSLGHTARVRGTVICEQSVTCGGLNEIIHDPGLHDNPPIGYAAKVTMVIANGSWKQIKQVPD